MISAFILLCYYCFFFFKQKTAYEMRISDWSSDVCSSDLISYFPGRCAVNQHQQAGPDIVVQVPRYSAALLVDRVFKGVATRVGLAQQMTHVIDKTRIRR